MKYSGIGGQAVLEGIMMKNKDNYATAVRKPDGEIVVKKDTYVSMTEKVKFFSLPFVRGIFNFADSMILGMRSLTWSASFFEVKIMKQGIHPNYYQAKVVCNCGNEFVTGSTKKDIHVEICSKCHSFYTGQQKAASARGRIEMFNRKYGMKTDK